MILLLLENKIFVTMNSYMHFNLPWILLNLKKLLYQNINKNSNTGYYCHNPFIKNEFFLKYDCKQHAFTVLLFLLCTCLYIYICVCVCVCVCTRHKYFPYK